jgi:hypothetical protein
MAEPTYRMSMLPFGTYANPDGTESLGLAVPGMIQEPINALMRLAENSRLPDGRLGIPNPDNAQNREDVLTGLLSMYGGNAMNPGRLMKGAAAKAAPEAAREAPYAMYRGAPNSDGLFPTDRPLFMSSSPEVAGTYAGMVPDGPGVGSVAPAQANFANPMVVDAQGRAWNDIPFNGNWIDSNALTYWARDAGHDGLVIKNVTDHLGAPGSVAPADTVVALKRGTVSSPLTGETLYSDTGKPSLFGSAIAGSETRSPSSLSFRKGVDEDFGDPYYAAVKDGNEVGRFGYTELPNAAMVESAWVEPEFRGQDIASRAYGHIQDDLGKPLTPDIVLSPDGYKFWQSRYPSAVQEHQFDGTNWVAKGGMVPFGSGERDLMSIMREQGAPKWRLSGGPNRPDGVLFSDNLPSIWGNALAPYQDEPRNALLNY